MLYNNLIPGLCLLMLTPIEAQDVKQQMPPDNHPSTQLLEFLADFGAIDDQAYDLIEYHALQDSKSEQEKTDEK